MKRYISLFVVLVLLLGMLPGTALGSSQEPEEDEQQLQAAVEEPFLAGQKEFIVQREAAPANVGRESLSQGSSTVSGTVSLPGGRQG